MGFFSKLFGKKKEEEKESFKVAEVEIDEILNKKNEKESINEKKDIELEEKIEIKDVESEKIDTLETKIIEKQKEEAEEYKEVKKEKKGFFTSLKEKLFKSREGLFGTLKSFILGRNVIDAEMYEELEDILVQSDIGMDMTIKIVAALEKEVKKRGIKDPKEVYPVLKEVMEGFLIKENNEIYIEDGKLNVI